MDAGRGITVCYMMWTTNTECRRNEATLRQRDVQGVDKDASLPMRPYSNAVPKILIGLDHGHLGFPLRSRRFARQGAYAAATELGWVVFGPLRHVMQHRSPAVDAFHQSRRIPKYRSRHVRHRHEDAAEESNARSQSREFQEKGSWKLASSREISSV
ncbi:GL20965 [Drosophila persimilis]|uniref:GL20965 n=1 Tax=Drosophila persimilis TaxID=7234 RepID=B4HCH9_DROPE|nr:GL20965 [Drosophila persimilis]